MASQYVLSTDETFFNGTIDGTQIVFETEKDEIVNSTVMSLSQGGKKPRTKKEPARDKPNLKNPKTSDKKNVTPKNTEEKKPGRRSGEAKREVLKVLNGDPPRKSTTAKPKSSPNKSALKVEPSPRKTKSEDKKTPKTPKIVIYQDSSCEKKRGRQTAERKSLRSSDGKKTPEKKSEKILPPKRKLTSLFNKNQTSEKSPSKGRGRLSKADVDVENLLAKLETLFPNVDPEWLKSCFWKFKGSLSSTIDYLLLKDKTNELPTKADYMKKQKTERQQKEYLENFSVENFLKMFPDPWEHFLKQEKQDCMKYKEHSVHYLKNKFRKHYTQAIQEALTKNNYSLYRANKELQKKSRLIKMRATNRSKAECDGKKPTTYNEQFMHEVAFIEKEASIKAYIKKTEAKKHKKFKQAQKAGTLLECLSCNDPSLLLDDAVNCPANHVFCKDCVVKSINAAVKNNNFSFKCLVKCEEIFSMESLQRVLSFEVIERIQNRNQVEELKAAEIKDLVWCPFCFYATVMPPELSILHCLNPDCLKESCRHCKELNHIPLKCHELEEFEKSVLENKDEEEEEEEEDQDEEKSADPPLICIQCNKEYLKTNETNKLVCPCGATICYVCRQPIPECPHFKDEPDKHGPKGELSPSNSSDVTDVTGDGKDSPVSKVFDFNEQLADFYPTNFYSL